MPLQNTRDDGVLTIGGISLNPTNGAWGIVGDERGEGGLVQLWAEFDVRGQDRVLPGANGVLAYRRRITATRHDLRLLVVGDVIGQTGAPANNPREGLAANLEYLRANVLAPVASATGTRAATLTVPGQSNRSADVHVLGLVTQSYMISGCHGLYVGTLQISIPAGRFA